MTCAIWNTVQLIYLNNVTEMDNAMKQNTNLHQNLIPWPNPCFRVNAVYFVPYSYLDRLNNRHGRYECTVYTVHMPERHAMLAESVAFYI